MKKIFKAGFSWKGIVIGVIVVVVAVLVVFFVLRGEKQETIKIGAVLSLSGPGTYNGEEVRDGMLLAVDEVNARGGINGRKIELIIEDSKSNPGEGKEAFNRIEKTHHPVLYVSVLSSISMALVPLSEQNEVVLVGLVVSTPKFTEQNEWVFRYWITPRDEVPPILTVLQDLKVKKLGVLYLNDEYGKSLFKLFKKEFEIIGGKVKSESFEPNDTDFKGQIAKLKDMEAIYAIGFPSHLKNVLKQLREESFGGFVVSTNAVSGSSIRSMPESNEVYVTVPIIYNPNFLFARELKGKYETEYDKPFTHYAASSYDFIKILTGLLEDEEISRESVKKVLEEGFIYSGVFGSVDLKPGEHDITFPLHPARIVDGEVKYLR